MNVFKLFAKLSLDAKEYEKGLSEAHSKAGSFVSGVKTVVGKAGDILATVGKAAAAAVGAASTAVGTLAKKSLEAYADFEQLEGGAKLMFGDAYDFIMQKSAEAYSTVQLSQNEYLQQVNGFAVGLKTALNGNEQAAAELADRIITAEADIVSATGNSQEAVQNAFNGIMKSNYTMLDNLQLGINPTKEGMQEVIDKVNAWNAAQGKATHYTMENLADVQSALVDYVEMQGLAGYASNEASETIQGSIAGMKAAWQNFLTGSGSAEQFADSLKTAAGNVKAKAKDIVPKMIEGLTAIADELAPEIPAVIEDLLPVVIGGASDLLAALAGRTPELVRTLLPALADGTVQTASALVSALPQLVSAIKETVPIVVRTIMSRKDELFQAGKDIIKALFPKGLSGVTEIAGKATEIIGDLAVKLTNPDNLSKIFNTGFDIINSIADGLLSEDSIDKFIETVPTVIKNLATALTDFITGGDDGEGGLFGAVYNIVDKICTYFDDPQNRTNFFMAAEDIILTLGDFLVENAGKIVPFIIKLAQRIAETLVSSLFDSIREIFDDEAGWMDEYLNTDTNLSYTEWAKQRHEREYAAESESHRYVGQAGFFDYSEGMLAANEAGQFQNAAAVEAYKKYKASQNAHADGFVADRPTWLGGHLIGEAGTEALIPLDSNTGWMDKFADKLSARMGGGVVIEQVIINAPSGRAEDIQAAFLDTLDEALRNRQITQSRGVGAVAWK